MYITIGKNLKLESTNDTKISKLVRDYSDIHDEIESKYQDTSEPLLLKDLLECLLKNYSIEWINIPYGATFVWRQGSTELPNPANVDGGSVIEYELTYSNGSRCVGSFLASNDFILDLSTLVENQYQVVLSANKTLSKAEITRHKGTSTQYTEEVTTFTNNTYTFYVDKNESISIKPYSDGWSYYDRSTSDVGYSYNCNNINQNTSVSATFNYEAWASLSIVLRDENGQIIQDITPYKDNITFTGDTNYYDYKKNEYSSAFVVWAKKNTSISYTINIQNYESVSDSYTFVDKEYTTYCDLILLCLYTIIPSPSNATVTLAASGYSQITGTNSILVPKGTTVVWLVECPPEYRPKNGSREVTTNPYNEPVTLDLYKRINIEDYDYTLNDEVVTLTKYIGSSVDVDTPEMEGM